MNFCCCLEKFRTARIWRDGKGIAELKGHEYGVEVCCLETGEIVTGSKSHLNFWSKDGQALHVKKFAHDRKLEI